MTPGARRRRLAASCGAGAADAARGRGGPPAAVRRLVPAQGQGQGGRAPLVTAVREVEEETGRSRRARSAPADDALPGAGRGAGWPTRWSPTGRCGTRVATSSSPRGGRDASGCRSRAARRRLTKRTDVDGARRLRPVSQGHPPLGPAAHGRDPVDSRASGRQARPDAVPDAAGSRPRTWCRCWTGSASRRCAARTAPRARHAAAVRPGRSACRSTVDARLGRTRYPEHQREVLARSWSRRPPAPDRARAAPRRWSPTWSGRLGAGRAGPATARRSVCARAAGGSCTCRTAGSSPTSATSRCG